MTDDLKMVRSGFRLLGALSPALAGRLAVNVFLTPRRRAISSSAQTIMAQATPLTIQHGSRKLAGYLWENSGPTVLLVHGWESNAGGMRGFVRPLMAAGFQVIAFDAPAHGRSQGRQTNFIDYNGALQTVLQQFGPVQAVVAHSFGAAVTLFTLSQHPYLGVQRIVSLGAPSRLKDMLTIWTSFLGISAATVEKMRQKLVDRVGFPLETMVVETAVSQLTIPGLIIHDRQDQVVSFANAEAIARNWQTATLQSTEGLDHRGPLQDREVIRQVVSFLAEDDRLVQSSRLDQSHVQ
jgi:pimeloyl-ACP methyl ester carboxylesterase